MTIKPVGAATPWYREPWPWILMAGPAAVIVAGAVTLWLAVSSFDGLVDDDYYKQGLAVNQRVYRDREAWVRGVEVDLSVVNERILVGVLRQKTGTPPPVLRVRLAHPTSRDRDRMLNLALAADGGYRADAGEGLEGRWQVTVDDAEGRWRLVGDWSVGGDGQLALRPPVPAGGAASGKGG